MGDSTTNKKILILSAVASELACAIKRFKLKRLPESHTDTCGLRTFYRGRCAGMHLIAAYTGMGVERARSFAADAIARFEPGRVLLLGYAGGLDPKLTTGSMLRVSGCSDGRGGWFDLGDGPPVECEAPPTTSTGVCALLTTDRMVSTPKEKAKLWSKHGYAAVDMESFGVAAAARDLGISLMIRRVVLDPADAGLWDGYAECTAADGSLSVSGTARVLVKNPWRLCGMMRLWRWARVCGTRLADEAESILRTAS